MEFYYICNNTFSFPSKNYSLCGFRDALTVRNVDDTVINSIEEYIKTDLPAILEEHCITLDKAIFFGNIYKPDPIKFKFSLGERIQLKEIAAAVETMLASDGIDKFKENKNAKFERRLHTSTVECRTLGRLFATSDTRDADSKTEHHKSKIFSNIIEILRSSSIDQNIIKSFNDKMIKVKNENGLMCATVECILCNTEKNQFKISAKARGKKLYWTTSNYTKHIKTSHTDKKQQIPPEIRRSPKASTSKKKATSEPVEQLDRSEIKDVHEQTELPDRTNCVQDVTDCMIDENIEVTDEFYKDLIKTDYDALQKSIYRKISDHTLKLMEQCYADNDELKEMTFTCGAKNSILRVRPIK